MPQGDVTADDVFGGDDNAGRYGTDNQNDDLQDDDKYEENDDSQNDDNPDVLDELFGQEGYDEDEDVEEYKPPAKQIENDDHELCSDYADQGFECVDLFLCTEDGEMIIDGGGYGLIDRRSNFGQVIDVDVGSSKCPNRDLDVCCRHPDFTDPVKPKPKPYSSRCGNRNVEGVGVRIQNYADEASTQFGEWPHMCAVLEVKNGKNFYVSGASLIADQVVMTAAHSVEKYAKNQEDYKLVVRCGEWDTQTSNEVAEHQDRDVYYINTHPGFNTRNLTNNIALLHVSEPFILSQHVDTICLGDEYDYDNCVATGWGKDKFGSDGEYQVILKQVELNVVPYDQCQDALRTTRLGKNFRLDKTALCAGGYGGVDTCKGDGGGPLVCPKAGSVVRDSYSSPSEVPQYVQAGIVGWGIGCGKDGIPGVYTDVSSMLCFIDAAVRCVNGDDYANDNFGIVNCDGWLEDEYAKLDYAIKSYRDQKRAAEGKRQKARFDRRLKEHRAIKAQFELWSSKCGTFENLEEEYEEYDDGYGPDLSTHTRVNDGNTDDADEE